MDQFSINSILSQVSIKNTSISNILITGCSGFIGAHILNTLLNKKFENKFNIYGVDVVKPKILNQSIQKKFFFIKRDLFKIKKFNYKIKFDLIIHLAGIPSPTFYKLKPIETFFLNAELCKIFLELAKKNNSKFIYFSSSEIYGNPDKKNIPTKESYEGRVSSISDRSCYDESKRAGETYTYIYKNLFNLNCRIIRPFNFYGNGMKKNDKRVIPQFFFTALNKNKILPFGKGKQTRTYCHIIDAIPQIINVCFFGKNFVYNIGNDNPEISAIELAKIVKKIINKKNIKITNISYPKSYPSNEPLRRCPDISLIRNEFKYKATISLKKGLEMFKDYAATNF